MGKCAEVKRLRREEAFRELANLLTDEDLKSYLNPAESLGGGSRLDEPT